MRRLFAVILVALVAAGCVAGSGPSAGGTTPGPTIGGASSTPAPPAAGSSAPPPGTPAPTAAWTPPPVPTTVDGTPVMTVSQALAARDAGTLGNSPITVGGYWSVRNSMMSCPMPVESPRELEWVCGGTAAGITERYEAINQVINGVQSTSIRGPDGPSLQPFIPASLTERLINGIINANWELSPVPIVVVGHFDDPRAAQCHPELQDACRKTFVLDRVLVFDPSSAPAPTPSPAPTPFPSPPPSGLFDPTACNGDVPYSFVGWTTPAELHSDLQGEGHLWAVVTRDVVPLGIWGEDPNLPAGHFSLPYGRRVCTAEIGQGSGIRYGVLLGSAYRLWDDGRRTADDVFGPGSGDPALPSPGVPPALPKPVVTTMAGPGLAPATASVRDWSGLLRSARPATTAELGTPGGETTTDHAAAAVALPGDPRSLLVVWAECGSDRAGTVIVTKGRSTILVKGDPRTDCTDPGARRGLVLTFSEDLPAHVEAITGL